MTTDSAAVRAGADLRVDMSPQSASTDDVSGSAAVTGVDAAAPALVAEIEIGSTDAQVVAVPASALQTVVTSAGGLVDKDALSRTATRPAESSSTTRFRSTAAIGLRVTAEHHGGSRRSHRGLARALVVDAAAGHRRPRTRERASARTDAGDSGTTMIAEFELPEAVGPVEPARDRGRRGHGRHGRRRAGRGARCGRSRRACRAGLHRSGTDAVLWLGDGGVSPDHADRGRRCRGRHAAGGGHGLDPLLRRSSASGSATHSSSATPAPVVAVRRSSRPSSTWCRGHPRRWRSSRRWRR